MDADDKGAVPAAPSDAELERAIASVPGVAGASVRRSESGRSRLRIRLVGGEDPKKVSWAIAATLRERFSIVLDPEAIAPRIQPSHPAAIEPPRRLAPHPDEEEASTSAPGSGQQERTDQPEPEDRSGWRERQLRARPPTARASTPSGPPAADPARESDRSPSEPAASVPEAAASVPEAAGSVPEPASRAPEPGDSPADEHDAAVDVSASDEQETAVGAEPVSTPEPAAASEPAVTSEPRRSHVGAPWPVPTDRSSRWMRRERSAQTSTESTDRGARSGVAGPSAVADEPSAVDPNPQRGAGWPASGAWPPSRPPTAGRSSGADVTKTAEPTPRSDHTDGTLGTAAVAQDADEPDAGAQPVSDGTAASTDEVLARGLETQRVARSERAAIRNLDTSRHERDVRVIATLEQAGRTSRGEATTVPTTHGMFRAVAEATLSALEVLVGPALVAGVDRVHVHPADDPANAMVAVSLITHRGEETLLGTSLVRGDPEHAVMRATLDALNRRLGELVVAQDTSLDDPAA